MYWCLSLPQEVQTKILRIAETFDLISPLWKVHADHITIIHSSHPNYSIVSTILHNFEGHSVRFRIVEIGISEKAVAFKVDVKTANAISHITIATAPDAKPVESNYIKKWDRLYCNEDFYGTLKLKV